MPTIVARLIAVIVLIWAVSPAGRPNVASAQEACSLTPVFQMLRNAAGAEVIGDCLGSSSLTSDGDLVQTTTRGALVLRVADGVAAFTDGTTTWLYGPEGLQSRPNDMRFAWETAPVAASPAAAPIETPAPAPDPLPPPSVVASPQPTATVSKLTDALAARCFRLTAGGSPSPFEARLTDDMMCRLSAEKWGEPGVVCVETAVAERNRAILRPPGPDPGGRAGDVYLTTLLLCDAGLSR